MSLRPGKERVRCVGVLQLQAREGTCGVCGRTTTTGQGRNVWGEWKYYSYRPGKERVGCVGVLQLQAREGMCEVCGSTTATGQGSNVWGV